MAHPGRPRTLPGIPRSLNPIPTGKIYVSETVHPRALLRRTHSHAQDGPMPGREVEEMPLDRSVLSDRV